MSQCDMSSMQLSEVQWSCLLSVWLRVGMAPCEARVVIIVGGVLTPNMSADQVHEQGVAAEAGQVDGRSPQKVG